MADWFDSFLLARPPAKATAASPRNVPEKLIMRTVIHPRESANAVIDQSPLSSAHAAASVTEPGFDIEPMGHFFLRRGEKIPAPNQSEIAPIKIAAVRLPVGPNSVFMREAGSYLVERCLCHWPWLNQMGRMLHVCILAKIRSGPNLIGLQREPTYVFFRPVQCRIQAKNPDE